ncbi:uncharacterized protein LOC131298558 [Rhododendron vialii]|uniref:uncharacterized protein LOC131298558 n=1 Tax=Rhododendron vialii TaxID=182163 RepID=UPI00265F8F87|nr:uncharacterized protein LOC131298558 [Rhododendron vialii]
MVIPFCIVDEGGNWSKKSIYANLYRSIRAGKLLRIGRGSHHNLSCSPIAGNRHPPPATRHHRLPPQPQLLPHRRQLPPEPASGTPTLSRTKVMVGRLGGQGSLITYGCELKSKRTGELTRFMG